MYDIDFATVNSETGLTQFIKLLIPKASGIKKMNNIFIKILFTTPGSDKFFPNIGGGIMDLTLEKVSRNDEVRIKSKVYDILTKTERQMIQMQQKISDMPDNERLESMLIRKVELNLPYSITIDLFLKNVNGDISGVNFPIVQRSI